ncbi:hypothetical protein KOW79_002244 [Hemibagrus wyckioides]|uniref:Uncharacterized protein n=1 Tax=Hemibagrus wyckioides TaxID=337641 RepID=A0A9D3P3L7_9TELE|nr:hypothetical protein KOW79_002244 [Hemibagrus wyckioides]
MRSAIPTGSVLKLGGWQKKQVNPFRRVTPGKQEDVLSWCTLPLIEEKDLPVNTRCSEPTSTYHTFSSSILNQ